MSSPEVSAPLLNESTVAPVAPAESTLAVEGVTSVEQPSPSLVVAADEPTSEPAVPAADELAPADQPKVAEAVKSEEKKEKKQGRKPFADLLNKILKPHPSEKSSPDQKVEAEAAPADEETAPEAVTPVVEAVTAEPEVTAEVTETAVAAPDEPVESVPAEDAAKDVTTPRKERANFLEKFTAFVMKPKSPKGKKCDATKEDSEHVKLEAPVVEAAPVDAQPAEDVASPTTAPEATETSAVEAAVIIEAPEEVKIEKKEKTPKDLAKLARRFSGRLFGVDKKKETSKKPEPTQEEAEASAENEAEAEVSDAAPQIPADTTPEAAPSSAEAASVIAAAA